MSKTSLEGKVALVTGGASGIGLATVKVLVAKGARVVVADIDEEAARRAVDDLGGPEVAHIVPVDVADEASVAAMVEATLERFGRLDIAHNNAGIAPGGDFLADHSRTSWDRLISINLTGIYLSMKAEIAVMLANGGGSIINTSSLVGVVGQAGQADYAAAKHGILGLTKTAALEYSARGIRVNAVLPGVIRTPMLTSFEKDHPEVVAQVALKHPIGRLGEPEEVGEAVAWLASDAASFVTGASLAVDGGCAAG